MYKQTKESTMSKYHKDASDWVNFNIGNMTVKEKIGEKTFTSSSKYVYITDILLAECSCGRECTINAKSAISNKTKVCRYCAMKKVDHAGETCGSLVCNSSYNTRSKSGRSVVMLDCTCTDCGANHTVKADIFRCAETGCPACVKSSKFIPSLRKATVKRYFSNIKSRAKKKGFDFTIDSEFLTELLISQSGKCVYSGLDICIEDGTASLDRINNGLGYTPENCQFVHRTVNFMKNELDEADFLYFCHQIAKNSPI